MVIDSEADHQLMIKLVSTSQINGRHQSENVIMFCEWINWFVDVKLQSEVIKDQLHYLADGDIKQ